MAAKRPKKQSKKAKTTSARGRKKTASKKTASKKTAPKKTAPKKTAPKKTASSASVALSAVPETSSKAASKSRRRSTKSSGEAPAQQSLFDESGSLPAKGVGGKVPDFALNDQDGKRVTLSDLLGVPFVLYFYPKDDTAGCTKEACDFQDQFSAYKRLGCRVVGVSPDSEASHKKFANKYGLDFTLLSDPEKTLCGALGVWQLKKNYGREYMGVVRSTLVIQSDGVIVRAFRAVKVAGHVPRVLEALKGVS